MCTYDRDLAGGPNLGGKVRYVSDGNGFMDGLGGVDGTVLTYRDVEARVVILDSKSSPAEVLIGVVGGAAKLSMQTWTRMRSHSPLNRCMAVKWQSSQLFFTLGRTMALDVANAKDSGLLNNMLQVVGPDY